MNSIKRYVINILTKFYWQNLLISNLETSDNPLICSLQSLLLGVFVNIQTTYHW